MLTVAPLRVPNGADRGQSDRALLVRRTVREAFSKSGIQYLRLQGTRIRSIPCLKDFVSQQLFHAAKARGYTPHSTVINFHRACDVPGQPLGSGSVPVKIALPLRISTL